MQCCHDNLHHNPLCSTAEVFEVTVPPEQGEHWRGGVGEGQGEGQRRGRGRRGGKTNTLTIKTQTMLILTILHAY